VKILTKQLMVRIFILLVILFIITTIMVRTAGTKKDPRYAGLNHYDNHSPAGDFVFYA